MAQETPWRPGEAATFFGRETTFATLPTTVRAFPCKDSVEVTLTQDELPVEDESVYLFDLQPPVKGRKGGSCKLSYYGRADGTQLTSAASPVVHPLGILLKAAFGAEATNAGSTVASSLSGTAIVVGAGHGSRYPLGSWGLFPIGGSLLPGRVSAVATDDLTLDLGIGGAATAAACPNMYNYYPTPGSTESLYIQHFKAGSSTNHIYALKGCICTGVEIDVAMNGLLKFTFTFSVADWEWPTDDSVIVTMGTDAMGAPFSLVDATVLLQTLATATRTNYKCSKLAVKITTGMEYQESINGGTQGRVSAYRSGERMFAELTFTTASADITPLTTWHASRTELQLVVMASSGSLTTKQWFVLDAPRCWVVGLPKQLPGKLALTEFTLQAAMRSRSGATDQARSPLTLALG